MLSTLPSHIASQTTLQTTLQTRVQRPPRRWLASALTGLLICLAGCSDGVVQPAPAPSPSPLAIPAAPTGVQSTPAAKAVALSWAASAGASTYQLLEDPDGPAGPLPAVVVAAGITATQIVHPIQALLYTRLNATYALQACNASGCSPASAAIAPDMAQAIAYIKASNPGTTDTFGGAVALSADGTTLAVGAYGEASASGAGPADNSAPRSGAVYVFVRTGGAWQQQAILKAPHAEADDFMGNIRSLALSADGNTLAVGADGEDSDHSGIFASPPADNNLAPESGAVYIFARSGSSWALQSFIKASQSAAFDFFGFSVALSRDGNTLAVGAYSDNWLGQGVNTSRIANSQTFFIGAAYVFSRSGVSWSEQAYIKPEVLGADGVYHQWFGFTVALSGDGNTLAVGSWGDRSNSASNPADYSLNQAGSVHTYTRSGTNWAFQNYLKAHNPQDNDQYGYALALSDDGQTLAVGMLGDDSNHTGSFSITPSDNDLLSASGAVYVYSRSVAGWSLQAYLKASAPDAGDQFGTQLALSGNGQRLVIAAPRESGSGLGFSGNPNDNGSAQSGAVYVFERSGSSWAQSRYLKASNAGAGDRFGIGLAIAADGHSIAVGAPRESSAASGIGGNAGDNSLTWAGAVYLY